MTGGRVPVRAAAWLAWATCAVCVALAVLDVAFGSWNYGSLSGLLAGVGWNAC